MLSLDNHKREVGSARDLDGVEGGPAVLSYTLQSCPLCSAAVPFRAFGAMPTRGTIRSFIKHHCAPASLHSTSNCKSSLSNGQPPYMGSLNSQVSCHADINLTAAMYSNFDSRLSTNAEKRVPLWHDTTAAQAPQSSGGPALVSHLFSCVRDPTNLIFFHTFRFVRQDR